MKRLLQPACLMALVLGFAQFPVRAQDEATAPPPPADQAPAGGRRAGAAAQMQRMKDKLNLTDDQVSQVKQIMKDQRSQGQALRQDDSLSNDDRRAKMQGLMKTTHDKIRALLTDDQQKIYDTMPMPGPGRRPPGPPPDGGDAPPPPPPPAN
jgi:protein CpxP